MAKTLSVAIVGGYLGAGKTTLLNALLGGARGVRLALIVNDFGSINIDAALIANRSGATIELTNGCACCAIGDSLASTLYDLASRRDGFDHVVIEASGVADPRRIAGFAAIHPRLSLAGVVVVADATTIRALAADKYVGDLVRDQLRAADMIVLSKTDLVDAPTCGDIRAWIAAEVPGARILDRAADAALATLLFTVGNAAESPARADSLVSPPHPQDEGHAQLFETWSVASAEPLSGPALRSAIATLPPAVIRAKGIVQLAEEPDTRFVLQLVGRRWSLEPLPNDKEPPAPRRSSAPFRSTIVCIGLAGQLDRRLLDALFARTRAAIAASPVALVPQQAVSQ